MGQIEEDYCSYQVGKLLKEKGFDENTTFYYTDGNTEKFLNRENLVGYDGFYPCPTHQMAMKWLRNKGICIQVRRSFNTYLYGAIILKDVSDIYATIPSKLETYEEATEAALKYSLENLI